MPRTTRLDVTRANLVANVLLATVFAVFVALMLVGGAGVAVTLMASALLVIFAALAAVWTRHWVHLTRHQPDLSGR